MKTYTEKDLQRAFAYGMIGAANRDSQDFMKALKAELKNSKEQFDQFLGWLEIIKEGLGE